MFLEEDVSDDDDDEKIKTSKRPYSEVNFAFSFFFNTLAWTKEIFVLHNLCCSNHKRNQWQAEVKVDYTHRMTEVFCFNNDDD